MTDGIYTLANDKVYDQLIAFLNSVAVNAGDYPVAVFAYDEHTERIAAEIAQRPNVTLLNDPALFKPWEDLSYQVWGTHPTALQNWQQQGIQGVRRLGANHRYAAFDATAPFDRFIYFDADVVVLNDLGFMFEQLDRSDVVTYDFQFKDPSHIYNVNSAKLHDIFPPGRIAQEIFCSGCFGGHRHLLPPEQRLDLVKQLAAGEAEILYPRAPNQSVLNYLLMRSRQSIHNFAVHLDPTESTGCAVTSTHFETRDHLLFDRGNRLTYLHYIGLDIALFPRLCAGENLDLPYRETFLTYRYWHHPEERPRFKGQPKPLDAPLSLLQRIRRKAKRWFSEGKSK
ncbi:MAG: sugar transferase [Spirulina sp. SIO3F2]|nr:sugar transferase [Spirulina sp. SIO3F2]